MDEYVHHKDGYDKKWHKGDAEHVGDFEKGFGPLHDIFRRIILCRDGSMTVDGVPIVSLTGKTGGQRPS